MINLNSSIPTMNIDIKSKKQPRIQIILIMESLWRMTCIRNSELAYLCTKKLYGMIFFN